MSQPQITSFVSKASVGKLKNSNDNPTDKVDTTESVFDLNNTNISDKSNPNKRPRTCISDSSDHSVCIERELEDIKKSMDKIVKKDDIEEIVTNIMGKLLNKWKTEIKKEILEEVTKERVKMKESYDKKFEMVGRKMDSIEFDNANLLEKNAALHTELRKMKEEIKQIETGVTEGIRMANWNEQYSRKKNIKIHNLEERRGEQLIPELLTTLKDKVGIELNKTDIVAMHRIPGKQGFPRPVIVKFVRMENKIAILKKRKDLQKSIEIKIGDDITQKNQGLINRMHLHESITSAWYFNGHVYGTDTDGERHRFDIFDNINQRLKK
ncbi:unnamed protein product [Mytilus edulis]|uniref:Uncharacterized protein n=1 Tax=Mytilus edulis TaxID=6550 RepID=A0A8S3SFI0_MYTED|nr:unnamed protein product [Mytilus edulis]